MYVYFQHKTFNLYHNKLPNTAATSVRGTQKIKLRNNKRRNSPNMQIHITNHLHTYVCFCLILNNARKNKTKFIINL